jgi:hypothetical protein
MHTLKILAKHFGQILRTQCGQHMEIMGRAEKGGVTKGNGNFTFDLTTSLSLSIKLLPTCLPCHNLHLFRILILFENLVI